MRPLKNPKVWSKKKWEMIVVWSKKLGIGTPTFNGNPQ
jgi:hypothetical protein